MEEQTEISPSPHPGDNFTPRGQNSSLGDNFTPGVKLRMGLWNVPKCLFQLVLFYFSNVSYRYE
jgi:hypothetical protein